MESQAFNFFAGPLYIFSLSEIFQDRKMLPEELYCLCIMMKAREP